MTEVPNGSAAQGESQIEPESQTSTEPAAVLSIWPERPRDPDSIQYMRLMERSSALAFWNAPEEDVYGPDDGEPV